MFEDINGCRYEFDKTVGELTCFGLERSVQEKPRDSGSNMG